MVASDADQRIKDWLRSLKRSLAYNGEWGSEDDEISALILESCSPVDTLPHASAALKDFMSELGEIMSMEDGATPADYLRRTRDIRQWCFDHQTPLDFVKALKIAEGVFEKYRTDQPKWWRRMDGTPILNDVAVRMAEAFRDHMKLPHPKKDPRDDWRNNLRGPDNDEGSS